MHRYVFPALVRWQNRRPAITTGVNTWLAQRYLGRPVQVGPDVLMLNTPMPLRHREAEAALPLPAAPDAVRAVLDLFRAGRPAVTFPLEIRLVRGDAGWLSPAYGADTCQIGAYAVEGPDCSSYLREFAAVMRELGARPHWGKEMDHDAAALRPLYPRYDDFVALRDALDPDRVFGGPFHARVLGD
jgi:FAD/FMN-containing dehydrogenase